MLRYFLPSCKAHIFCFVVAASLPSLAKEPAASFKVEPVVSGLAIPWALAQLPDGSLLITERGGQLKHFDSATRRLTAVAGLPVIYANGQGGLMDVALAPDYSSSSWLYFTYSKKVAGQGRTALARAKYSAKRLSQWQDLLVTDSGSNTGRHFGSRIAFDSQGHVFFSVGDRGVRDEAQNLGNHMGTIIRLKLDGSVPLDNPFIANAKARKEIWSYGHRNPQGLVFDTKTQRLWAIEHGPRGGDELNLVKPGVNYGWPVISYGKEYWGPISVGEGSHKDGMAQPHKYYVPSIAPGSLLLYNGAAFPQWQGSLFAGALKLRHLNRLSLDGQGKVVAEQRLLESRTQRIRALMQSPEGWLYFSTDSGSIFVIKPDA